MKLCIILLAVIATTFAALPSSDYLPPLEDPSPSNNADLQSLSDSSPLGDDGYRYKIVRRLRHRQRRDVSEIPSNEYLPALASDAQPVIDLPVVAPAPEAQPEASQDSAVLADDGYRYKTVKRYRLRHRRDVNELPSNEYLPPSGPEFAAPIEKQSDAAVEEPQSESEAPVESAALADDGYRYRTVKRYRLRHRRDVSELPANKYLPPASQEEAAPAPAEEKSAEPENESAASIEEPQSVNEAAVESAALADDGYRYKTVKRYRLRHRRDVSELPSSEYLPPASQEEAAPAPAEEKSAEPENESAASVEEPQSVNEAPVESAALADDGYRYKTVKRYRLRHRRDVSELPANQYLPPASQEEAEPAPAEEKSAEPESEPAASVEEPQSVNEAPVESAALADDGYRYRTVKRYRLRHRRDVSELPSSEYLPPAESVEAPVETAPLSDDGYRYKTAKRVVYKHRQ